MWWEQKVVPDGDRTEWAWVPLGSVGPLRFGTSRDEVIELLGNPTSIGWDRDERWAHFGSLGVQTYYDRQEDGGLMAVIVDALNGPQVRYNGTALTGRPPSELNRWMEETVDIGPLHTSVYGEPSLPSLGLVLRPTANGDRTFSRPVFTGQAWAQCPHPEEVLPPPWA